jgi:hypothetical protein
MHPSSPTTCSLLERIPEVALDLSRSRKIEYILGIGYTRFLDNMVISTPEEMARDWGNAWTFLITAIIDWRINFVDEIEPECYCFLESKWLDEVKELKAYYNWIDRGGRVAPAGDMVSDYRAACKNICDNLCNSNIKASPSEFGHIKDYLEKNYLKGGKIDKHKVNDLIELKAHRISEKTSSRDQLANWGHAEKYVETFYENIIPAIVRKDPKSISNVRNIFCNDSLENSDIIINSFECALVIYFL